MRLRNLAEIILLGLMWGPSFLFIKLGIEHLSPLTVVAGRMAIGGALLCLLLKLRGTTFPRSLKVWGHLAVVGFFSASLPFTLFAIGELTVSSALAGIINGTTPLFTALLAHFWIPSERLNLGRASGILLGVVGFLVLLLPTIFSSTLSGDTSGIVMVLVASVSYAVAFVYTRRYVPTDLKPLVAPAAMFVASLTYMVPLAILAEAFWTPSAFTYQATLSVLGLAVFGTACAYILYYRIIKHSGAISLSMSLYVMAFFSVFLGWLILSERLHWTAVVAGVLIIAGMVIVNRRNSNSATNQVKN